MILTDARDARTKNWFKDLPSIDLKFLEAFCFKDQPFVHYINITKFRISLSANRTGEQNYNKANKHSSSKEHVRCIFFSYMRKH